MKITLDKKWAYAHDPKTEVEVGIIPNGYVVSRPECGQLCLHRGGGHCIDGVPSLDLVPLQETVKGWFNVCGSAFFGPHETRKDADRNSPGYRADCIYMTQTTPPEED